MSHLKRTLILTSLLGALALPASASAAPPVPWDGLQIEGTTFGTTCHLNRCWGTSYGITYVTASSFWSVAKCGVAIGFFIAGNGVLIAKVRKVGGVYKAAKKLWKVRKNRVRRWEVARDLFGYTTGVGAVVEACS